MLGRSARGGVVKTVATSEFISPASTTVEEAMHPGVLACPPDVPLRAVARMMALYRVHAIVVDSSEEVGRGAGVWGVVSDLDLVASAAVGDVDTRSAGSAARTPLVTIVRDASLQEAAALMARHRVSHLVVVSSSAGQPVGIVSSLDIARALALEPGCDS
jgi:CBS domain-containing protein